MVRIDVVVDIHQDDLAHGENRHIGPLEKAPHLRIASSNGQMIAAVFDRGEVEPVISIQFLEDTEDAPRDPQRAE